MAKVLIPIPSRDFDPTEVAVSWDVLRRLGHSVAFATPDGRPGEADDMMLTVGQINNFLGNTIYFMSEYKGIFFIFFRKKILEL